MTAALILPGCASFVYTHPVKSESELVSDRTACMREATRKVFMNRGGGDPFAYRQLLHRQHIQKCLGEKGWVRSDP